MAVHGIRTEGSHRGSRSMDDAVNRCMKEDNVCTAEVLAALDLLAAKATLMPCYGCGVNNLTAAGR